MITTIVQRFLLNKGALAFKGLIILWLKKPLAEGFYEFEALPKSYWKLFMAKSLSRCTQFNYNEILLEDLALAIQSPRKHSNTTLAIKNFLWLYERTLGIP